jgi:hypothetical protein
VSAVLQHVEHDGRRVVLDGAGRLARLDLAGTASVAEATAGTVRMIGALACADLRLVGARTVALSSGHFAVVSYRDAANERSPFVVGVALAESEAEAARDATIDAVLGPARSVFLTGARRLVAAGIAVAAVVHNDVLIELGDSHAAGSLVRLLAAPGEAGLVAARTALVHLRALVLDQGAVALAVPVEVERSDRPSRTAIAEAWLALLHDSLG